MSTKPNREAGFIPIDRPWRRKPSSVQVGSEIPETVLAWVAGLIDGEGCIRIARTLGNGSARYVLQVTVKMCDEATILRLREIFGTGLTAVARQIPAKHRDAHVWRCAGETAAEVIRLLRPYLFTKAREADIAIEFAGCVTLAIDVGGFPLPIYDPRDDLYLRLREAKGRIQDGRGD